MGSSVQAVWHTPVVDLPGLEDDPFAEGAPANIEDVGVAICLDGDEAELSEELVRLVERESRLFEQGVECAIKDRSDTSCYACPLFEVDPAITRLCRLGRDQERVTTQLAVVKCSP